MRTAAHEVAERSNTSPDTVRSVAIYQDPELARLLLEADRAIAMADARFYEEFQKPALAALVDEL